MRVQVHEMRLEMDYQIPVEYDDFLDDDLDDADEDCLFFSFRPAFPALPPCRPSAGS